MARQLIFISGGVRSGKSSFAEELAADIANLTNGRLHYIAAGQASDNEMDLRIKRHQEDRANSGYEWKTWEQPTELTKLSTSFQHGDIILLDCLTTLLNNEFFRGNSLNDPEYQYEVMYEIKEGIIQILSQCHTLIVVSNEVLNDPLGNNELVMAYGKTLGELHQFVTSLADQAYLVEAGIPLQMKGGQVT
ncbi:bifunctional adenosylcobinamide kinase/adenosylcobinamide-phosphate guanylyltransferase [Cytobacillus purgationiresistens]|uniref:Adenosylcobinamide kinase n=1 Tax=Cytobacillus purgationiresistens TaxID=863449 RepID=A0ABU0APM1_9BACI|nr:bifunctional adenosylcobinamide kinase/adenosylcobinamide-phosphate guanylyltransferase [Cytobacillus purgationiresistens]MDQ0273238.1 adenosylcobinamide kinase/adenosylcobinamide-phosphate guanylyltransferase [Cytobacillus purgationiresistens]